MHFGHVLTAMITPFDSVGQIDFDRMTMLIEYLLDHGTEGLVITGTTGESAVLSSEEKERIYDHVTKIVNKRVPVLAGTGTNDTKTSIIATNIAEKHDIDGVMLVSPYYNRPNQKGLYEHFKTIAAETTLPIMLYNVPGRCSVHMEAETTIALSKIKNITALKEASGNLDHTAKIIANTTDDFFVYSGDDSMTLPMMAIGATGVVSVASHIIGPSLQKMVVAFQRGNVNEATNIHLENIDIMKELFKAPSPAPVKAALRMKGITVGSVRLPLVDLTSEEKKQLQKLIS